MVASLLASAAHFGHNAMFLDQYPGPPWIPGPRFVVGAWCVIALVLVSGYRWFRAGKFTLGLVAVGAYSLSCLLVFAHYLYGPPSQFDALTNALIFLEGASGVALFAGYAQAFRRRVSAG